MKPGPEGLLEFQNQVRLLLGFDITDEFDVTFECQLPQTGVQGKGAWWWWWCSLNFPAVCAC